MAVPPLKGLLLFAFIPLVLWLFLRTPLGVGPSLALGVAIMVGHRFVARPYLRAEASHRCLWCTRRLGPLAMEFPVASQATVLDMRACGGAHLQRLESFARLAALVSLPVRALILGPLIFYLLNGALAAVGLPHVPMEAAAWIFKIPVALAVVGVSLAYPLGARLAQSPTIDFPMHNLFLLGIATILWVFRIVGLWWLLSGLLRLLAT